MRHKPKRRYPKPKARYVTQQCAGYGLIYDLVKKTVTMVVDVKTEEDT